MSNCKAALPALFASRLAPTGNEMSAEKAPIEDHGRITTVGDAHCAYMSAAGDDWEPAGERMWMKRIYENGDRGERTLLFRMEPDSCSPPHSHEEFEQVYVLAGSFYDEHRLLRAGDFCVRSPGAVHSAASDDGALMLVMYTKA
jgi:quercetin dioxygenase-like cupin family protein